jgi:hypothetical protein
LAHDKVVFVFAGYRGHDVGPFKTCLPLDFRFASVANYGGFSEKRLKPLRLLGVFFQEQDLVVVVD